MGDGQIMVRIQNLSEGEVEGTHLDEKTMKRRLKIFRTLNDPTTGDEIVEDFFRENKVEIHHIDGNAQVSNIIESIIQPKPLKEEDHQMEIKKKIEQQAEMRKKAR